MKTSVGDHCFSLVEYPLEDEEEEAEEEIVRKETMAEQDEVMLTSLQSERIVTLWYYEGRSEQGRRRRRRGQNAASEREHEQNEEADQSIQFQRTSLTNVQQSVSSTHSLSTIMLAAILPPSLSQDRETFVEQTPRAVFSDNVTQWAIFDAYNEDYDLQVRPSGTGICTKERIPFVAESQREGAQEELAEEG